MKESDTSKYSFSMSFFSFIEGAVSPSFWMYLGFSLPLTLIILAACWFWYRRDKSFQAEFDRRLEQSMPIWKSEKLVS
jgi:hypothetical protein